MFTYAGRTSQLKPSAIREILKLTRIPNAISFAAGNPAPESFPVEKISDITNRILTEEPIAALQYSVSEGYAPLISLVKNRIKEFNPKTDEIVITAGAQQVMEISAKLLAEEGSTVLCESPTFAGSLNAFRSYGVKLRGVPVDKDGIITEKLEAAIKEVKPAFVYLIPNFQNPTGLCTSLSRRKEVLDIAERYDVPIIEDNPYGELRWRGTDIPSLKELAIAGNRKVNIIYAGSFSKILAPGLRVGYMCADAEIALRSVAALQTETVHTSALPQMVAYRFFNENDMAEHIKGLKKIYQHKCQLMLDELRAKMPHAIDFTDPDGGMFIWATIANPDESRDEVACLFQKALEDKVIIVPGAAFLVDDKEKCYSFRLNFSTPTNDEIVEGVNRLAKVANTIWK